MGLFDSSKKIYPKEFRGALKKIPELSPKERAYAEEAFQKSLKDGLSMFELRREIEKLRHNSNDPLEPYEVEKIKQKLMEKLGG